jgi:hypothetical protein
LMYFIPLFRITMLQNSDNKGFKAIMRQNN